MIEDPHDERIVDTVDNTLSAYDEYMAEEKFISEGHLSPEDEALAKEYEALVKVVPESQLKDCIKIGFANIKHYTAKAILLETYKPLTGELYEQWLPKGVCSNLDYKGKFVYVWNQFAKDQLEDWYKEPLL